MAAPPENTPNDSDHVIKQNIALSTLTKVEPMPSTEKLHSTVKRLLPYITIFILLALLTTVSISLKVCSSREDKDDKNSTFSIISKNGEFSLSHHIMFTKDQWRGRPSLNFTKPLHHPTAYVLISHTAGKFCNNFDECARTLQQIQLRHVAQLRSPDIGYNFLIGGGGNVYVGRGWDIRNFHKDNSIGISFIGNFVYDSLTTRMISALKDLLALGVKLNKLPADYKLVCQNQTYATLSPGENVFREIEKFPNFIPGRVEIQSWTQ